MKIPPLTFLVAALLGSAGCSSSPTTVAVATKIESDTSTVMGTSLTAVRVTVTTPIPMTTQPLLVGPRQGTGPMFSDERGTEIFCPVFHYPNGKQSAYIISYPDW